MLQEREREREREREIETGINLPQLLLLKKERLSLLFRGSIQLSELKHEEKERKRRLPEEKQADKYKRQKGTSN